MDRDELFANQPATEQHLAKAFAARCFELEHSRLAVTRDDASLCRMGSPESAATGHALQCACRDSTSITARIPLGVGEAFLRFRLEGK